MRTVSSGRSTQAQPAEGRPGPSDDDGDIHHDGEDAYDEISPPSSQSEPGQIETLRQQQQCARAGSGRPVPLQIVVEGQDDQNGQENQDG